MPQSIFVPFLCSQWLFLGMSQGSSWRVFSSISVTFSPCPSWGGCQDLRDQQPEFISLLVHIWPGVSMPHWMEVRAWLWQC